MAAQEFWVGWPTGIWTSASRRVFEWQKALTWNCRASSLTFSITISGPITTLVSITTVVLALSERWERESRETSRSAFASASNLVRFFTFGRTLGCGRYFCGGRVQTGAGLIFRHRTC